jgi:hypothetical protein
MTAISLFSGSAGVQLGDWSFVGIDKLGHLAVFGLLGIAWTRALQPLRKPANGTWLLAVCLTGGFGLLDELHQYTNPLRYFEWADLLADIAGAALAAGLYLKAGPFRRLLEVDLRAVLRLRSADKLTNSPS